MTQQLPKILKKLKDKIKAGEKFDYFIPSLWTVENFKNNPRLLKINPYKFFAKQIEKILCSKPAPLISGSPSPSSSPSEPARSPSRPYGRAGRSWLVPTSSSGHSPLPPHDWRAGKGEDFLNVVPSPLAEEKGVVPANAGSAGEGAEVGGEWSRKAVIYNIFVRLTTAFDHDQNGLLDFPKNSAGFRETGTFLKTIALLPYIKKLGVNTLHFLPVTAIGKDGIKGNLGSPYATRNPFLLDENLAEPALGVGVETEFRALMEAAHYLGMRVIVEFVFRTAAKDSDWVKEHPEWFYWIKDSVPNRVPGSTDPNRYGSPIFESKILEKIKNRISRGILEKSIPPPQIYREMFTEHPRPGRIKKEGTRWVGVLKDGTRVKIPGAFADWPPDDLQPPWDDVTYLKMYDHPDFNYIAYNTVRMYDPSLAQGENINRCLWKTISEIIPTYQKKYRIDGVMIDMGHALPLPLLGEMQRKAREKNPDFAFWEENFNPTPESRKHGYNAAIGYLWSDEHDPQKLTQLLQKFSNENFPVPFFGTAESHNSPRAATYDEGVSYSKFAWAINNFLPVIPFIHSGFELGEEKPVNTGLNFSEEEIKKYPAEKLPLFSLGSLDWLNPLQFCDWVRKVGKIRAQFSKLIINPDPSTFNLLYAPQPETSSEQALNPLPWERGEVFVFERKDQDTTLVIAGNRNIEKESSLQLNAFWGKAGLEDLVTGEKINLSRGEFSLLLHPGEVRIFQVLEPVAQPQKCHSGDCKETSLRPEGLCPRGIYNRMQKNRFWTSQNDKKTSSATASLS